MSGTERPAAPAGAASGRQTASIPDDDAGTKRQPSLTPRAAADKAARAERVAAEMRKNLIKRKQQQRHMREDRGAARPSGEDG